MTETFVEKLGVTFHSENAFDINMARLRHLDGLGLALAGKTVLEVGSGIGLLTAFFEEKKCQVLSTEARAENVQMNLKLHPYRQGRVVQRDLTWEGSHDDLGAFDVTFCYGTLYHIPNPQVMIEDLARVTRELLLLETCVAFEDNGEINPVNERTDLPDQAFVRGGCRPGRNWVFRALKRYFPFVHVSATQPDHPDFPLQWPVPKGTPGNARSIFVASRGKILSPALLDSLPAVQTRA